MYNKDAQEELERLEAELLEDTEVTPPEIPAEDIKVDDVLNDPVIRSVMEELDAQEATRVIPETPEVTEEPEEEVIPEYTDGEDEEAPKEHVKGLLITALCLSVGIIAILGWWLIRYPGLFL